MRILKAVYNRATEDGLTEQRHPFKSVYTGVEKTLKRAISLGDLKRIKGLDLSLKPNLDFARDMFLFCFYTRGMSFIDMAYLRKKDLQNGILSYRRRKTGQQLFIKWEKCMQEIVDKYPVNETEYLLPIITEQNKDYRKQYTNELHRVNHLLKKIGKQLNLPIPLTMYVGRHSWASIAKSRNVPISVISEGWGMIRRTPRRFILHRWIPQWWIKPIRRYWICCEAVNVLQICPTLSKRRINYSISLILRYIFYFHR